MNFLQLNLRIGVATSKMCFPHKFLIILRAKELSGKGPPILGVKCAATPRLCPQNGKFLEYSQSLKTIALVGMSLSYSH